MEKKKNVLIVGNSISAIAMAKKLHAQDRTEKIYITGLQSSLSDEFEFVDIREDKVDELLSFVLEKSIDLTIIVSKKALKADVAGVFSANGQMVFAPDFDSVKNFIDLALTKKFLYKLKIPTSKFGVFEKQQLALDYVKNANYPIIIKTSEPKSERDVFACPTVSVANIAVNDLFFKAENKIVIEEYIQGHNFNFYFITDGYKILPFGVVTSYRFSDDVDGGYLTLGSGACMPDFKITCDIEEKIMKDFVIRILSFLENNGTPYVGILGLNCVLSDDKVFVQSIEPFLSDVDSQPLLNSIDEDLYDLFMACAMGVFADDYDKILINDFSSVAVSLFSRTENNEILGLDKLEHPENLILSGMYKFNKIYTTRGCVGVMSAKASTLGRAKVNLSEEIELITFEGIKYRKDILN